MATIEDGVKLVNSTITINGSANCLYFSTSRCNYYLRVDANNNNSFFIGKNNFINGPITISCSESKNVIIGDDCLFSFGIWIRTSDPHLIYDATTKMRINPSKSVYIGDHVWVGQSAVILKNSRIGSGSIIGANSVLTGKQYFSNCSYAGDPAKLVKENVFFTKDCAHRWGTEETQKHQIFDSDDYIYNDSSNAIDIEQLDKKLENTSADEKLKIITEYIVNNTEKSRFCFKKN
jgi:acetyltransferase-like isoleucine patch superfamily enzyme